MPEKSLKHEHRRSFTHFACISANASLRITVNCNTSAAVVDIFVAGNVTEHLLHLFQPRESFAWSKAQCVYECPLAEKTNSSQAGF